MTKKTVKQKRKNQESPEPVQDAPAFKEAALIGIIGWNSPRFMEGHGSFVDLLKKGVAVQGGATAFYGISGGADLLQGFKGNGYHAGSKENKSHPMSLRPN